MADVFISYKKEDAGRVIRIVEALREEGFSVWWDHGITPGAQWDQTIHDELKNAKVVIAIWSKQSVEAPWVKEEAAVGKQRGILLPIRIDEVDPPLGFTLIQTGDLAGWDGKRDDPHWRLVLDALRALIRGERPKGLEAPPRKKARIPVLLLTLGVLLLAGLGFAYFALRDISSVTYSRTSPAGGSSADTVAVTRGVPQTAPAASAPKGLAPEQDNAAWAQALESKTRQSLQLYLVMFPSGAHATTARDMLLTCRTETREAWKEQRTGQMIRGVNTEALPTQAAACAAAREFAAATADRSCRAISANEGYRNGKVTMVEGPCDCRETPAGFFCTADPSYSCAFEQRTQEPVETCG